MNYFELLGMPVSLQVDQVLLKKRYDEQASRADLNKAYAVLQDQDDTMEYVLKLKGLLTEGEEFEIEPQFMMEVMDINEELMELELDEKQEQLMNVEQKTNRLLLKIYEDVSPVVDNYKEDLTTEEELLQVKDFYFQKKYLLRILDKIRGIRNIASPS